MATWHKARWTTSIFPSFSRSTRSAMPTICSTHREPGDPQTLRRNGPSRNGTVTVCAGVGSMLGAERSRSAHARRGAGGARRLHTPTLAGAALLQQLFEVDPFACPTCHGPMRIVAFITQALVIDQTSRTSAAGPRPRRPAAREPQGHGGPERCLSTAPIPPNDVRGRSACAAVPPGGPVPAADTPAPTARQARRCGGMSRRRPSAGHRAAGRPAVYSTDPDRISYPEPSRTRSNFRPLRRFVAKRFVVMGCARCSWVVA